MRILWVTVYWQEEVSVEVVAEVVVDLQRETWEPDNNMDTTKIIEMEEEEEDIKILEILTTTATVTVTVIQAIIAIITIIPITIIILIEAGERVVLEVEGH